MCAGLAQTTYVTVRTQRKRTRTLTQWQFHRHRSVLDLRLAVEFIYSKVKRMKYSMNILSILQCFERNFFIAIKELQPAPGFKEFQRRPPDFRLFFRNSSNLTHSTGVNSFLMLIHRLFQVVFLPSWLLAQILFVIAFFQPASMAYNERYLSKL